MRYAPYGWIIDRDVIGDEPSSNDLCGPRNIDPAIEKSLRDGKDGVWFQMFDDDWNLYYEGRYVGPDDETMFAPLDDFGTPNAGAVTIKYKNAAGEWEVL
jgi:hypothetical protein